MNSLLSSWDLVKVYLMVMRQGSLSSAARAMGISQPTARRQIEALEAELGVTLFTRAPSGLLPTDQGSGLLAQAEAAEAAMGAFQRGASGSASGENGTVRITCPEIYGVEILPRILSSIMRDYPGIKTELVLSNRVDDLLNREADIAVRMVAPKQEALLARKVKPVPLGFYATKEFLKTYPAPKTYDELVERGRFISDDRRYLTAKAFQAVKLKPPKNIVFKTDSDLAQLAAIRAGLGIGVCQTRFAAQSSLVRVLPQMSFILESWIVMHEDLKPTRRVRLVFDRLVKALD
ncbi:MAG: LysR family transcriptional regulator [Aestuariivirga sp.]